MLNNTSDYATSAERKYELTKMVIEGEEADIVLKYANKFKNKAETELLQTIAETDDETTTMKAVIRYKSVCEFVDMLKSLVATGVKKRSTLQGFNIKEE